MSALATSCSARQKRTSCRSLPLRCDATHKAGSPRQPLPAPTTERIYLALGEGRKNEPSRNARRCARERGIKTLIQHKQPPTRTPTASARNVSARTRARTHADTPPQRGKQKTLTSSCIMCLKCGGETAKRAVTVTGLKTKSEPRRRRQSNLGRRR